MHFVFELHVSLVLGAFLRRVRCVHLRLRRVRLCQLHCVPCLRSQLHQLRCMRCMRCLGVLHCVRLRLRLTALRALVG